jgi:hypothetical protein
MPNPNDAARAGNAVARSEKLVASAAATAQTKRSWSEWFGAASNTWLGGATTAYLADMAAGATRGGATTLAATALSTSLAAITGFWVVAVAGPVVVDIIGKKLEDMAKEGAPKAFEKVREVAGKRVYGGENPNLVLNRPVQEGTETHTLEKTLENIKENSALIQDLLNKLSGKAGKAWFCDDVYQIAALASKLNDTKAELAGNIELLRRFLTQLEGDLAHIDAGVIQDKVVELSTAVCGASDGRHWDNTWAAATVKRMARCSKEHCYGPK